MGFCATILSQICFGLASQFLVYVAIALAMILEGEIFLLVAGSLVHFGLLDFWPLVAAAILGTWLSDIIWYQIGSRWGEKFIRRFGKWFFITPERFLKMQKVIWESGSWFILISKFSYGLNHLFMITAGSVKYGFKKFLKYQLPISAIWAMAFVLLGKVFALSLNVVHKDIKIIGIGILILAGLLLLSERLISRKFFAKVNEKNETEEKQKEGVDRSL
ncbi:MAG TPA: DedA family protein [Candidatus Portnoybacteria bacterium]|nr:DedA family protein [Candidatus Portnoybacteria bacterium]